jgi:uncharacterized HAD superfamily protein
MQTKRSAVICDIDGTLADNSHRKHWVDTKPKNWNAYNKTMNLDKPIDQVIHAITCISLSTPIIICTGREEIYRDVTEAWLEDRDIRYNALYMRKAKDYRDDAIVKSEMLDEILKTRDVIAVFDDRTKVVDMWRSRGLFVFDCNQTREIF